MLESSPQMEKKFSEGDMWEEELKKDALEEVSESEQERDEVRMGGAWQSPVSHSQRGKRSTEGV